MTFQVKHKYYYFIITLFGIAALLTVCKERETSDINIHWAEDGMLIIEGRRKFIIGSYHHPKTENPFQTLQDNGYNFVRIKPTEGYLDSAAKYGLYAWISTGSVKSNNDSTRISNLVNNFKDHPSMLCWEIEDEPAFTWKSAEPRISPETMEKTFSLIKSVDKNHLIYTNHAPVNLISTLKNYNRSTDIAACDVYPVIPHGIQPTYALFEDGMQGDLLNTYISQVGEYTDKMRNVVDNKKPVFMVLQGFAWEMLKTEENRESEMILYPGYEESRFMAYNAIVHGASGIVYWGTNFTPQPSKFIDNLNRVTNELCSYQEILSLKNIKKKINIKYHELGHSVDSGVEFIIKEYNNEIYIISVNSDKNPAKVTFSGLRNYIAVDVLKEDRKMEIIKGSFTDYYNKFDVHIYKLTES